MCVLFAGFPPLLVTCSFPRHPKQNLQITHALYCRLFSGTPCINILLDLCLSNIALWDGSFVIVPGGGDCMEFSSVFCVLPDEKYVDVDGWIDEGSKWKEDEKSPLQSLGCFCELCFNVLQAHLQHNTRRGP